MQLRILFVVAASAIGNLIEQASEHNATSFMALLENDIGLRGKNITFSRTISLES